MKRGEQLQPPVDEVRVKMDVQPVDDPELLRWFGRWLQKLLNEPGAPEQGRRS